ncbi:MAG: prevent-host-death family protein [Chlamydiales bacterium]|jgi:prevent-host-death family protein
MGFVTDLEESKKEQIITKLNKKSFSETRQELTDIINRVHYAKETFVVQKNGRDMAVIVPVEEFEKMQALKEEGKSSRITQVDDIIDGQSKNDEELLTKEEVLK